VTEQALLEAEPAAAATDSKWIAGISADQPVCEVAARVLDARLKAVYSSLPLAAERSDEDVEHVHRLRISVRRAAEAVRVFSGLIDEAEIDSLRDRLRRIRLAADEARNWDVMAERFAHGGAPAHLRERINARRREVQGPIVAMQQEIAANACEEKIDILVREVECRHWGKGKRRFGRQAPRYLAPVVKKFFRAAESDLGTDESLHGLRIRTKKLRYTMEIVAVTFDSAFRKRLYSQVTLFQDLLGTLNDHATAKMLFGEWLSKAENNNVEQKAFLEGLLLAEDGATEDLRAAFLAAWTPKVVSGLKCQFRRYC
jgi:CHAD domain-containing protein